MNISFLNYFAKRQAHLTEAKRQDRQDARAITGMLTSAAVTSAWALPADITHCSLIETAKQNLGPAGTLAVTAGLFAVSTISFLSKHSREFKNRGSIVLQGAIAGLILSNLTPFLNYGGSLEYTASTIKEGVSQPGGKTRGELATEDALAQVMYSEVIKTKAAQRKNPMAGTLSQ